MRVWKKVPNVACLASDDGKIRHLYPPNKKIADEFERPQYYSQSQGHRYKIVKIYSRSHYVHRLVAAAFHGPCPKGLVVDHIDGNRFNNHANNLRYLTANENKQRSIMIGARPKLLPIQVEEIRKLAIMKISISAIAKRFKVSYNTISKAVKHQKPYD